jgi:hypothetical protein
LQGAVAADRQVSEGWMWSCYTSARAGELSCSHERTADVLGLVQFSFRSHSKSLFCWPLHSASAFCIHNQPLSASLHSIAAVQHSSAPRPLFGCVVEHRIATAPAAFSTPDRPCSFPETRPSEASLAITRQPSLHHSLSTHPFHAGICLPRRVVFVITGEPLRAHTNSGHSRLPCRQSHLPRLWQPSTKWSGREALSSLAASSPQANETSLHFAASYCIALSPLLTRPTRFPHWPAATEHTHDLYLNNQTRPRPQ